MALLIGILFIIGTYIVGMQIRDSQGIRLVFVTDYHDLTNEKYICSFKADTGNASYFSLNKKFCDRLKKGGPISIIVQNETTFNGATVAEVIGIRGLS